jgi:hypothetical protein
MTGAEESGADQAGADEAGHPSGYRTPDALWTAVTDRIRNTARANPQLNVTNLQRQFVYGRLLARVFTLGGEDWVLKGGTALLARVRSARHSKDIDLYRKLGTLETAIAELSRAAEVDLHDHFRFVISGPPTITTERAGQPDSALATVPVDAYAGARLLLSVKIDLVIGAVITGTPDRLHPTPPVTIPGLVNTDYLVYPLVDHIADKLCATVELHGQNNVPSTRVRDLVDLVVIARTQTVDAPALRHAIETERLHRNLAPITRYVTPPAWAQQYSKLARPLPDCAQHQTYPLATGLVSRLLDPILSGAATSGGMGSRNRTMESQDTPGVLMSSGGFWFGDRPFAVAPRGGLVVAGAGLEAAVQDADQAAGQSS